MANAGGCPGFCTDKGSYPSHFNVSFHFHVLYNSSHGLDLLSFGTRLLSLATFPSPPNQSDSHESKSPAEIPPIIGGELLPNVSQSPAKLITNYLPNP